MLDLFLKLSAFFYPVVCCVCGTNIPADKKYRICPRCKKNLKKIEGCLCVICGMPLKDGGEHCYICRKNKKSFYFDRMRSAYLYKDSVRSLILKFKYSNGMFLARDLAEAMIEIADKNDFYLQTDIIVPVPLNILRRIKRGYNQAALLAFEIGKNIGKPVNEKILIRNKITKPQFKLNKKDREKNIENSFFVKNPNEIKKKKILLVDDIVTTAATASYCAKALKDAGASKVYVLTLARD